ncbi:hypothetical protein [Spirosoma endbachense]|uniref:Uncharacterized protein n=1 Tax=Spirosoma endbachense TaxID=2666025 RepID=A0A6P1W5J2_9BACT|nr:hypothetical protein [Spirosoma endbachense]QHV99307.1 hypothetical protein GJR95_31745 [Spirosoma endbachense]
MNMEQTDDEFGKSIRGTISGIVGNEFQYSDWGIPFFDEMTDLFVEAGYDKSLNDSPDVIAKGWAGNSRALGAEYGPYVVVAVYVAQQIGDWAIGKFCDAVFKGAKRVFSNKGYNGRIRIVIVYNDNLGIAVDSLARSDEDALLLSTSIMEASNELLQGSN